MRTFTALIVTGALTFSDRREAITNAKAFAEITGVTVPVHGYTKRGSGNYDEHYLGRAVVNSRTGKISWLGARPGRVRRSRR